MESERYKMTLDDIPPWISQVVRKGVLYGYVSQATKPGYVLADGTALLESERDENGFYIGGIGMDGIYLRTGALYEPVRNEKGSVTAFRKMDRFVGLFTGEEQQLIFQYALNTPAHLIEDLTDALPALERDPQTHALFCETIRKLNQVPPGNCVRLMADLRAAYQGRAEQLIRERQKAVRKSGKRERGTER